MKKQITIEEVAKRAGVSKATVSRAINNSPRVRAKTRNLINGIIKTLGYHPNTAAREIRTKVSRTIGMILPNITNPFYAELVRGAEDQARLSGYQIMTTNTDEKPEHEYADINNLLNQMVDGLIIISTGVIDNYQQILRNTPTIFVDRLPSKKEVNHFDTLLVDNVKGSFEAVNTLIHNGAERIGFINSFVPDVNTRRMIGYKKALDANNITYDPDIIQESNRKATNVEKLTGQLIINQACDGLFAANNTIFKQILLKIKKSHIKNVKLATFDDDFFYQFLDHGMTVIQQPAHQMGSKAVINLIYRINTPKLPIKHTLLKPTLKRYFWLTILKPYKKSASKFEVLLFYLWF